MTDGRFNVLVDRATVAATATLGATAGFVLGCAFVVPLAANHIQKYLDRVALQDNVSAKEAEGLLATLQHSAKPPCSDVELTYFRDLVFGSDYLRDVGRIRGGRIECSATAGRPVRPMGQFEAGRAALDLSNGGGKLVPIHDRSLQRAGIQEGDYFVLFGSHLPLVADSLPVHLAIDRGRENSTVVSRLGSREAAASQEGDYVTREGDLIVGRHCSALLSSCVTASIGVGEAQRNEIPFISASAILGAIAAGSLGMFICVIRHRRRSIDQQLRRAVLEEKLQVAYQPIVNLANGKIVGAEALARWTTQDGDPVKPEVFIKIAEEHGFVGSITNLVLRRALREFREVFTQVPDFRLNVNVAAADLVDPDFLPMLDQAVQEAKIRPQNLVLEVTESTTASREDAMESIRMLRQRGHSIYIDDFGTGYSNLSYLLYLSVDTIKIDKAFVRAIGTESVSVAILPQILAMARSMNLGVVVEGIESEGQANYFSTDNLRIYGQGYLFGRPAPAREFYLLLGLNPEHLPTTIEATPQGMPSPWGRFGEGTAPAVIP
jgi:sensor c-di-GMP phosphodiesterase-like protein